MINEQERSLAGVVAELKEEVKTFLETRYAMLMSELKDKLSALKMALPAIVLGAVLCGTAWLLLTGALVAAIWVAFQSMAFGAAIALVIVGVAYLLVGGIAVLFAWRGLSELGLMPKRTMRVLKDDSVWIRNEARTQL